jgi:tRNA A-37 threonylcarbamoyl transferase component Bud32
MTERAHDHEPDGRLIEVAGAVADRTPVDWEQEQGRTPEHARLLARLSEIAALQDAHDRLAIPSSAGPATDGALFHWGPLQAIEAIGSGSFADVYRAWDPTLEREVALKLRRADAGRSTLDDRRWIEEARRLARIRHPNVLVVHGADTHDGRAGIWTELLVGQTLEQWIVARGALGPREATVVGMDLCAALSAVHAAGLIHGDVTTHNVMRAGSSGSSDGSGRIVLMDFGTAHDEARPNLIAFGTPLFTAPELLDGSAPSPRSDVYSLGIILYRLLTARYPVTPGPVARIREQLTDGSRTALRDARPDLPVGLVQAVERAAAPDPDARFASAAALEQALGAFLPAGRSVAPRRPYRFAAMAAGLIALLTIGTFAWIRTRPVSPEPAPTASTAPVQETAPPSVVPAPAPVTPNAPAMLRVEATLYRTTAGSREALANGDAIAPGDALGLEVETSGPAHVYVLDEDQRGQVFALFPLRSRGAANPVGAGVRHRLPGTEDGRPLEWQVTSAGGRETILILVSAKPLDTIEQAVAGLAEPAPGAPVTYPSLDREALARLRGVGGIRRGEPLQKAEGKSILAALAGGLSRRPDGSLWMRMIELENP